MSVRIPVLFRMGMRGSFLRRAAGAVLLLAAFAAVPRAMAQAAAQKPSGKRTPIELLQTAHTLFLQRDYEAAREYYQEVLPSFPDNFDILKNLAYCFYMRGPRGYAQAASYYEMAHKLNPNSLEVADYLALCLVGLGRPADAGALYQKMAQRPNGLAIAWKKAGEAYAAADRIPQAKESYDAYLQRNPGDLEARARMGDLYVREKNYTQAQEQYRIVLTSNPDYSLALLGLARLSAWQNQREEALRLYDRVLKQDANNGEALTGKAFVLLWMGRHQEARDLFLQLSQRFPRDADIARGLGQAEAALQEKELAEARTAGEPARAEAVYRQRLQRDPKDVMALRALTEATATSARCSESVSFGRRLLEIDPNDNATELRVARSLVLCQQFSEAATQYNHFLQRNPKSQEALTELGSTLLRANRASEAVEPFQKAFQLDPRSSTAGIGLAVALAANGKYDEAGARYDDVLKTSPDNYDALQGKAYVLFWQGQFDASRRIFQALAAKQPNDSQNQVALKNIAAAEEEAKWASLRPAPNAPPQEFLSYFDKRLAVQPDDLVALKGRAYILAQMNDFPAAVRAYRQVLEQEPGDRASKKELARLLARETQYDESIRVYQEILRDSPEDTDTLENVARVYVWSGHDNQALASYQKLLAQNPTNMDYQMEAARIQIRLKDDVGARQSLNAVLAAQPQNREARAELAQLEMRAGNRTGALSNYEEVLKQDPNDPTALYGKAQIAYYQGNMPQAYAATSQLVQAQPNNFDAVFLLANIEHARRHKKQSLQLLDRADHILPNNPDVAAMRQRIRQESRITLSTVATYTREIGPPTSVGDRSGLPNEDLRSFSYGGTIGLSFLPRTTSYFSYTALPSNSPIGPSRDPIGNQVPTGITGAVAPQMFLYRQLTRFSDQFSVRGGIGMIRFGPGTEISMPAVPLLVHSADFDIVGLAGWTYAFNNKLSFDLDVDRMPVTYTPTSVRLGFMVDRFIPAVNFTFTPRTTLRLEYTFAHYVSRELAGQTRYTRDAHVGAAYFNRVIVSSSRFSLDGGYKGIVYGFNGVNRDQFTGFFAPGEYQQHLVTGRIYGPLAGPVSYDIYGGIGLQKVEKSGPLTRASIVSPTFNFKVNDNFSFGVGYIHYNTAQGLGPLRGNAVRVTTDWKF
ncbi:MAG: tetratricopeptide repeat protein [Terriglobia bacterium]